MKMLLVGALLFSLVACGGDVGESCDSEDDCLPKLTCVKIRDAKECREDWGLEGAPCVNGQCQEDFTCLAEKGQTCTLTKWEDETCSVSEECEEELVCSFLVGLPHCSQPFGEGELCLDSNDCAAGLVCEENVCRVYCESDSDCPEALICVAPRDHRCLEGKKAGEECQWTEECAEGLFCNDGTYPGHCSDIGDEGDPCGSTEHCAPGLHCDKSSSGPGGHCAGPASRGEYCGEDWHCKDGLHCYSDMMFSDKEGCFGPGDEGWHCDTHHGDDDCKAGLSCCGDFLPTCEYSCY